ncbi:MAG: DUF488 domain-containing protein [Ktedonobacteraceae bacterium]
MKPKLITIGVYGFDRDSFFQALQDAHVDTFCDIRLRRGMRGSEYAFVNSTRLQQQLQQLGIRYIHMKELAPSQSIRDQQKIEDKRNRQAKRTRTTLEQTFISAYEAGCLSAFDATDFMQKVGTEAKVISLFCVERDPQACHRSLAARKIAHDLNLQLEHITPSGIPISLKN